MDFPGILFVLTPLTGAILTGWSFGSETTGEWYTSLQKPYWTPASYVFAPVWFILVCVYTFLVTCNL